MSMRAESMRESLRMIPPVVFVGGGNSIANADLARWPDDISGGEASCTEGERAGCSEQRAGSSAGDLLAARCHLLACDGEVLLYKARIPRPADHAGVDSADA